MYGVVMGCFFRPMHADPENETTMVLIIGVTRKEFTKNIIRMFTSRIHRKSSIII